MKKIMIALAAVLGLIASPSAPIVADEPVAVELVAPEGLTNCVSGGRTGTTYVEANGYCRANCSYCANKKVSMTYFVPKLGRNVTSTGNCVDSPYDSSVVRIYNSVMSGKQTFVSSTMVSC